MCFSAPVSLTTSAGLAVLGVLSLRKAREKQELPFAAIPLLFAVQQFIEGILWLTLPQAGSILEQYWLTQSYVVFIGIIWPMLIPFSLFLIEPDRIKKRLIQGVFLLGIVVAAYTVSIIQRFGVSADIVNECIVYQYPGDDQPGILAIYFVATCMGFFFSSHHNIRWIGAANVAGFIIAYYFYRFNYASVWCFFAAVVSALIYWYFERRAKYSLKPYLAV